MVDHIVELVEARAAEIDGREGAAGGGIADVTKVTPSVTLARLRIRA